MSAVPKPRLTEEEYLAIERAAEFKSEFFDGRMFPLGGPPESMAGTNRAHNRIATLLAREIGNQFRGRPCELFFADMRLRIDSAGLYVYPDLMALCGPARFLDAREDTLLNPQLLVEVLSPSTEGYDRGEKFERYATVASVTEYVLVAQDRVAVTVFRREGPDVPWETTLLTSLSDHLELRSVGCRVALAEIYAGAPFAAAPAAP